MIDTLLRLLPHVGPNQYAGKSYALVTLHRPSNVDNPSELASILQALNEIASETEIVFPVHPRTRQMMGDLTDIKFEPKLHFVDPVGYLEFLGLQQKAAFVITDSGGVQEETTFLGIPCLTIRENTERPVTISMGSNILVGKDMDRLKMESRKILSGDIKKGSIPPLWDGKAGERIATVLA
jgi:UDP-N-acetylglucosamine 2-epimerase (non-hydrolysing)